MAQQRQRALYLGGAGRMTYREEVGAVLARLGKRCGRAVTLQEYEPAYRDAEEVPEPKRAVLLRALQREDAALALMLGMAAESVNLADKVALYERALAMIREEYGLQMGRLVTFARFKAMIAKEIEKIAKAGR